MQPPLSPNVTIGSKRLQSAIVDGDCGRVRARCSQRFSGESSGL